MSIQYFYWINFLHEEYLLLQAVIMSKNSGFNEAPPTKNPSISGLDINSTAFLPVTDPPY